MEKLIATASERLAKINAGNGQYANDEPFDVPGSNLDNPRIWSLDLNVGARTHAEQWLVHRNLSWTKQVVPSLRQPYPTTSAPASRTNGGYLTTVRRFLNTWACRPLSNYGYGVVYVKGIDYQSTYNNPVASVERMKVPLLILGMSAGQLLVSGETIFDHAASSDKLLVFIEGGNSRDNSNRRIAVRKYNDDNRQHHRALAEHTILILAEGPTSAVGERLDLPKNGRERLQPFPAPVHSYRFTNLPLLGSILGVPGGQ